MDKKQLLEDRFMTSAKFSQEVEKIALHNPEMNYIDSVIHYCEENEIELDSVNKLISKPLKEKLRYEAQQLNFMKKEKIYIKKFQIILLKLKINLVKR